MQKVARSALTSLFLAFFASHAHGSTFEFNLSFTDVSGTHVGDGYVRYDPSIREDLYVSNRGDRCYDPSSSDCNYFSTWTPLETFNAVIADYDIFGLGSDTELWLEGTYSWHSRYQVGGFDEERWFVGDIYFGESVFITSPLPLGTDFFQTEFSFLRIPDTFVSGTIEMAHVVPAPSAWASLGLALIVLVGWRSFLGYRSASGYQRL